MTLLNRANFFTYAKKHLFGGKLTQDQVDGLNAILEATDCWPVSWRAYALATAYHETAFTMKPIAEYGKGRGRKYGLKGKHGQVAYGRGYVQLTWDYNYEKADIELKLNNALIKNYELAMRPDIAAAILREGMEEGWFTGKSLKTYLPAEIGTYEQFKQCRRIINGTDKWDKIATEATHFQKALLS